MADFDIDISEIAEEDPYTVQGGMRNYVADEGVATVPRRWKSRPGQPETQLAYITDDEAALLKKENIHKKDNPEEMGTVNVGPDGVPSYDDSGMAADYYDAPSSDDDIPFVPLPPQLGGPQNVMSKAVAQALTERARQRNLAAAAATRDPTVTFDSSPFSGPLDYDEYTTVRDPTRPARNVMGILAAQRAAQQERDYIEQSINKLRAVAQSSTRQGSKAALTTPLTEEEEERRDRGVEGRGPIDQFMGWAYKDWIPKGGQVKERTTGHSSDYGITGLHGGDAGYRDPDVGAVIGSALMMSPVGVVRALAKNQYLADPSRERAEAMAGRDRWNPYGPSWVYGQPKPKSKDYGDGGDHPLLKKRPPLGGGPSGVATPQGIVSGDTIFGDRTKTFTGFDPNAATAGARGAFQYFNNPVVAQRGGLLDAAEIQRFQKGGKPKRGFFGKLLSPALGEIKDTLLEIGRTYTPDALLNNASDPVNENDNSRNKNPDGSIADDWGNFLGDAAALTKYPAAALRIPGAIWQSPYTKRGVAALQDLFTSDPQIDPGAMPFTSPEGMRTTAQQIQEATRPDFVDRTYWFGNPRHGHGGIPTEVISTDEGDYTAIDMGDYMAAIDTTSGLNRGGAIRSSDLAGDYGTMNRMISDPTGIASLGRGGDTMLVHMRPDEVAAMSMDGRTTVNPHTGLPERFWGSTLGGLAGSFFGPWGVGIGSGLGQALESKLGGAKTGDALTRGLYTGALAGLGSYGLGKYAEAGHKAVGDKVADPNFFQTMLGKPGTDRVMAGDGQFAKLLGNRVNPMTAGLAGLGGSIFGEMAAPPIAPPEEEPITQRQAIARPKSARGLSGDPATYGSGAEQYLLSRNKGIFDYTFAQEGGLMEAAQEEEVVETSPDGVEMAYLQEDEEVMTPPGIPGMEEGMDIIVKEAVMAIRGEHPQPERAIAEYIEIYGEEDFAALQEMVTQDQALQGMGEAPVEVAEASETVEEMPLMAARGGALNGPGKGRDDQIPVLASDGEYIIAADVVSGLGDGSTKAGAQTLDAMADRVRQMRTGTQKQPEILPEEMALPA